MTGGCAMQSAPAWYLQPNMHVKAVVSRVGALKSLCICADHSWALAQHGTDRQARSVGLGRQQRGPAGYRCGNPLPAPSPGAHLPCRGHNHVCGGRYSCCAFVDALHTNAEVQVSCTTIHEHVDAPANYLHEARSSACQSQSHLISPHLISSHLSELHSLTSCIDF